ncbi:MAG: sulfotransferase [Flavobacteriaceae bacterium]|nr:sulfotransferase [Flavobacteriaceae bacterium]
MKRKIEDYWITNSPDRLPDFIIGGAMKSGTTSLHTILGRHPDVDMAHDELGFFDMDSLIQHPDFNFYDRRNDQWIHQNMNSAPGRYWSWYFEQFPSKSKNQGLTGEDSTTYLASEQAAERIAAQAKTIKMIFILRHPTHRAISNYLHLLKSGRAIYSLEDTLRFNPHSILNRSRYKSQLEGYLRHMEAKNILVIGFERFLSNKRETMKEVCEFLGLDFGKYQHADLDAHSNRTRSPKHFKLQLWRNRMLRRTGNLRYATHLPVRPEKLPKKSFKARLIDSFHNKINPRSHKNRFKPKKSTMEYMDSYFKCDLAGLDELVGKPLMKKWFNH